MAKKKKSKRSDYIGYLLFKTILFALRSLPLALSRCFCVKLGRLAFKLDKKHREITQKNLALSFPDKTEEEILKMSKEVFYNLGLTLFDYVRMPTFNSANYKEHFEFEGIEHIKAAKKRGKGAILLSAHICCWELLVAHCLEFDGESAGLGKDLHNPYVNKYVKEMRRSYGAEVLETRHSIRRVMKLLKSGGYVLALLDQNTHKHEAELVDFFGRKAATQYFVALLALKLDMSIVPMFMSRVGKDKYKIIYRKPCEFNITGDRKQDIHHITQVLTKVIEDEIRLRPAEWFWVHNRWKGA